jgi:UPF0755 protein
VKRWLLIGAVVLLALAMLALFEILWAPNKFEGTRVVTVSKGLTFTQVMDSLESAGVIRSRLLFNAAGRMLGLTTRMQIGRYRFAGGMSNKAILEDLRTGASIELITVTFPEGMRTSRYAAILAKEIGIDSSRFARLADDIDLAQHLGLPARSASGFLLPNTYKFYWQTDEEEIVGMLVKEFQTFFNDSLQAAARKRGMSISEIVTMASIIEAETSIDSERAVVAGVYYNRLKKRMRLEADPTVQFIIDDGPRRLRYSDLQRPSPYNTYLNYGLPPGPINNPGKASILAAVFPQDHKYLFFVANGRGGHTFSTTFDEHRRAAGILRKIREQQQIQQHQQAMEKEQG